jgi:hypothetical protein
MRVTVPDGVARDVAWTVTVRFTGLFTAGAVGETVSVVVVRASAPDAACGAAWAVAATPTAGCPTAARKSAEVPASLGG